MWLRIERGLAALLLVSMVGCVDLEVQNPNAPDAARALASAGDVESLIAGAFDRWLYVHRYGGPSMFLSNIAGEHVAPWANAGMEYYARIPRNPTANNPGHSDVGNLIYAWTQAYRAIAAVHDGLKQMDDQVVDLGDDETRARAYGKFMQGLAHGTIALLYDSGFVYDETMNPEDEVPLQGYSAVMTAALGYLDQAITLATGASFTMPETWMSHEVSSETLVELAYSWKARFRTAVARTPAERTAVDWGAVATEVANGVTEDWDVHTQCWPHVFCDEGISYRLFPGWQMQNNWVAGMADVSGAYQTWVNTPLLDKLAFIIITPDTRWPQGPDEATQLDNPGEYYSMNTGSSRIWSRPDRGTWRWSYYYQTYEPFFSMSLDDVGDLPQVKVEEGKALLAEKAYYDGNMQAVADFVNETRTLHGLAATDAAGTNTDCVPRLPNGNCGNLWEMFKWEKRLETQFAGPIRVGWYFDGRGWGDLMEGSILQFPVPYREMQLLEQTPYDLGGVGGNWGAPVGTYGY